jgi:phage/plasmid-like protein (TIGR03299 family)
MPHELTITNGKAEMFYYGDTPWHGLGTKVDHALTAWDAIKAAGLDWTVQKRMLFLKNGDDLTESNAYATVREDNGLVLGIVGSDYTIVQNHEAFAFLDSLTVSTEAKYHTAGSIRGGKKIWLLAKLPGSMVVKKDDLIDKYLLLLNSHDARTALKVMFTPVRVVCQNTLMLAFKGAQMLVSVRHNQPLEAQIMKARYVLGISSKYFTEQERIFNIFADTRLSESEIKDYFRNVFIEEESVEGDESLHAKKRLDLLLRLHEEGAGAELSRGTLWGAYNAVVEYVDHHRVGFDNPKYLGGLLVGSGLKVKTDAYRKALETSVNY